MENSIDVFVIGGGPAGLAVAIAARQQGLSVVVADGAQPPIDKACGEGLLPDGVAALERLGVEIPLAQGRAFSGVRFLSSNLSADAAFSADSFGLAVRRTRLHPMLMERAAQLGAELRWGTPVLGISAEGVQLRGGSLRARWIVGADGANSRVRRWAGLDSGPRPRLRYAFRRHFRVAPWNDHMEVYWGERCQGYATAVDSEQVCVALASHDPTLRLEEGLREFPALCARLRGTEVVSSERGALTGNRRYRRVARRNVALVGDASGTVDAITGEGLGLAFSQAVALADCMRGGDLRSSNSSSFSSSSFTSSSFDWSSYERAHRQLALRPWMMARLMLTMDGRPRLQHRTLEVFQQRPEIFRRLLDLHVGKVAPLQLAVDGLTLGWGLLTA